MELWKRSLLFLTISFVLHAPLVGQQPNRPISLGMGLAYRDFQGIPQGNWEQRSFQPVTNFTMGIFLNPYLDANFSLGINSMDWVESDRIESLTDIEASLRYYFTHSFAHIERKRVSPFIVGGVGTLTRGKGPREMNFHLPMGAGIRLYPLRNVYVDFQALYKLSEARDYAVGSVSLGWELGSLKPKDSDGDGIPDPKDDCPLEPGHPAFSGCPDTDGDGISDKLDRCPLIAGYSLFEGCPPPLPDTDGDGVVDPNDLCPGVAGNPKAGGCPDQDGDGVRDSLDLCPEVPGKPSFSGCPDQDNDGVPDDRDDCPTQKGPFTTKGCPDADLDGVPDIADECPLDAGPIHLKGCPSSQLNKAEETQLKLDSTSNRIRFKKASSELTESSVQILQEIGEILKQNPQFDLQIEGHTDNSGAPPFNMKLSRERVEACASMLQELGIAADRLSFQGYGSTRPIADNSTELGRSQNRRVEFKLISKQ